MNNEKGVTLIELLGVLLILSVLITLAGSILTSSIKTSNRATTDQRLQQEANYITEALRNKYLERKDEALQLKIDSRQLLLKDEAVPEPEYIVFSEGYTYSFCIDEQEPMAENEECKKGILKRSESQQSFQLILTSKDGERVYKIETKFSKLK